MAEYVPPGWPAGVHPPASDGFERTAVAWLLDVVPPDYRLYGVLRRYPVALAVMAHYHLKACVDSARQGYRTARTELGGALPAHALDAVLAAYRSEGERLVATARAVDLVARALRGEVFTPRLRDSPHNGKAPQRGQTENGRSRDSRSPAGQPPDGQTANSQAAAKRSANGRSDSRPATSPAATSPAATSPAADGRTAEGRPRQPAKRQTSGQKPSSDKPGTGKPAKQRSSSST